MLLHSDGMCLLLDQHVTMAWRGSIDVGIPTTVHLYKTLLNTYAHQNIAFWQESTKQHTRISAEGCVTNS